MTESPVPTPAATDANRENASDNGTPRRAFQIRGFTSLLLTLTFVAVVFSGVILYLSPRGRTAHWTDWTMLGLGKEEWGALHMNTCAALILITLLHLVFNWKMFFSYLYKKAVGGLNLKWELLTATGLTVLLVAGTICAWPPLGELAKLNTRIKNSWETTAARAPVPHSEELTLEEFAQQIHLSVEDVAKALAAEGYAVDDPTRTVGDIAHDKGDPPSAVLAAIQKHHPGAMSQQGPGRGAGPGRGMGMGPGGGQGRGMGPGGGQGRGMGPGGGRGMGMGGGRHMDSADHTSPTAEAPTANADE